MDSIDNWNAARDRSDSFPEICPVCHEKWKHCEDYERHLEEASSHSSPD